MNNDRMDELNEQLEDAYFALLLNRYAESEGRKQQEEYEKAAAQNELLPVPEDLDAKCRDLIRKSSAKGRRKQLIQRTLPRIGRIAAVLLIVIGLCTTLVFSVDALRIPTINFIIDQYERYTSIGKDVQEPPTDPTESNQESPTEILPNNQTPSPLAGILPDTFEMLNHRISPSGSLVCAYRGPDNCVINYSVSSYSGVLNVDTEGASTEPISILGYSGFLITKGEKLTIVWVDEPGNKVYHMTSSSIGTNQLMEYAIAVTQQYCKLEENTQ